MLDATVSWEFAMKNPFDGSTTLDGVIVATGIGPTMVELELGDIVVEKDTFPVKSMKVLTVIVDVAGWPAKTVMLLGLAVKWKSGAQYGTLHAVSGCSSHPEKLW
jgi:hypothetical protein